MKPKSKKSDKPLVGRGGKREGSGRKRELSSELKNKVKVYIGAANVVKWNAIKRAYCDDGDTLFTKKLLEFAEKHMELLASYFTGDKPREERCITPEEHCHEDDPNGPPQYFICLRVTFDLHRWFCKLHTHSQLEPSAFIIHLLLLYTRWHDIVEEFRPEVVSKLVEELQGQLHEKTSSLDKLRTTDNASKTAQASGSGVSYLGEEKCTQTGRLAQNHQLIQTQAEISQSVEFPSHSVIHNQPVISEDPKTIPSSFRQVQGQTFENQGQTFTVQGQVFEGQVQGPTLGGDVLAPGNIGGTQIQGSEIQGHILESGTQVIVNVIPESVQQTQVHGQHSYTLTPSGERQAPLLGTALNLSSLQAAVPDGNYEVNIVTSAPLNQTQNRSNETIIQSQQQYHYQHVPNRPLSEPIRIYALNKQVSVVPDRNLKMLEQLEVVEAEGTENVNDAVTKVDSKSTRNPGQHLGFEETRDCEPVMKDQQSSSTGPNMLVDVPQDLSSNHAASGHLVRTPCSYKTLALQNIPSSHELVPSYQSQLRSHAFGHSLNQLSQEIQTIGARHSEGPTQIKVLDKLHSLPNNQDSQTAKCIIVHCAPPEGIHNVVASGPVQHNMIQNSNGPITILPTDAQLVPGHIVLDISQDTVSGTGCINVVNVQDPPVQLVVSSSSAFHPVSPSNSSSSLPMSAHQNCPVFLSKTHLVSAHQNSPVFLSHFQMPETSVQQSRTDSQPLYSRTQLQGIDDRGQCLDYSQHQAVSSNHGCDPAVTTQQQNLISSATPQVLPNSVHCPAAVVDDRSGIRLKGIPSAPPQVLPNRELYKTAVFDNPSGAAIQRTPSAPPQLLPNREHYQTVVLDNSPVAAIQQIPSAPPQVLPDREHCQTVVFDNPSGATIQRIPSAPPQVLLNRQHPHTEVFDNPSETSIGRVPSAPPQVLPNREPYRPSFTNNRSLTSVKQTSSTAPQGLSNRHDHQQTVVVDNPLGTYTEQISSASPQVLPNRLYHQTAVVDNQSRTSFEQIPAAPPQVLLANRELYQTSGVGNRSVISVKQTKPVPPEVLSNKQQNPTEVTDNSSGTSIKQMSSAPLQVLPNRELYRTNQSVISVQQAQSAPPQVLSSTEQYQSANVNDWPVISPRQQMYTSTHLQLLGRQEPHQTVASHSRPVTSHPPMQDPVPVMTSRERPQTIPVHNPPVTFPHSLLQVRAPLHVLTREDPKTANISDPSVISKRTRQPAPPSRRDVQPITRPNYSKDFSGPNMPVPPFHAQQNQDKLIQKNNTSASQQPLLTSTPSDVLFIREEYHPQLGSDNVYSREGSRSGQHALVPKLPVPSLGKADQFLYRPSQVVRSSSISDVVSSGGTPGIMHSAQLGGSGNVHSCPGLHPRPHLLAMDQGDIGARSTVRAGHDQLPEQAKSNNAHLRVDLRDGHALQNHTQMYSQIIETKDRNMGKSGLEILATSALGHHSHIQNKSSESVDADERSRMADVMHNTVSAPLKPKTSSGNLLVGQTTDASRMVVPTRQALIDAGLATEYVQGNLGDKSLGAREVPILAQAPRTLVTKHSLPDLSPYSHTPSNLIPSVTVLTSTSDGLDKRKKHTAVQSAKTACKSQEVTVHDIPLTSPKPLVTQQQTLPLKAGKQGFEKQTMKEDLQTSSKQTTQQTSGRQTSSRQTTQQTSSRQTTQLTSASPSVCEKDSKAFQPPPSCMKLKELLLRRTKATLPGLFDEGSAREKVGEQVNQGVNIDRVCPNEDGESLPDSLSQTMEPELSDSADDIITKSTKPKSRKPARIMKRKRSDRSSRSSVSRSTKKKTVEIETAEVPKADSRRKRHKSNTGFTGEVFAEMPRFPTTRASRRKADNKDQNRCLFPDFNAEKTEASKLKRDITNTCEQDYIVREKVNEKGKKTKNYECKICHALRTSVGNIKRHLVAHRRVFKCTCCNKNFSTKNGLYFHKKKKSGNKFNCTLCSFSTYYVPFLRAHVKRSHPEKPEKVFCDVCGKSLKNKASLKSHLLCHKSEEIKEVCGDCGKLFPSVKYLHRHQKRVHSTKDHVCTHSKCDKSFPSKGQLKAHVDRVHLKVRKFACTYPKCSQAFFKMAELQQHICVHHTKERTFVCKENNCGKAFRSRHNLVVHMRLHTNEKPFKCTLCDYSCRQKNALNFHMERRHFEKASRKGQKKSDKTKAPMKKCKNSEQQSILISPSGSEPRTTSAECPTFGLSNQTAAGTCSEEYGFHHHPTEGSYSIISPVNVQTTQILCIPASEQMSSAQHMTSTGPSVSSLVPPPGTNATLATLTPLQSSGLVPTLGSGSQCIETGNAPMDTLQVGECVVEYRGPL